MTFTLATFTLQIVGYEPRPDSDKRVLANLPAMIESIEEDFTDLLPEGYTVKIREWNAP